ncbi:MAG: hypothetical protein GC192_14945 [Bacteroidetes bacterium]|nr:hypothetical protein [Bacteroidota bacterium]
MGLSLLAFWGCFRKKAAISNLQDWLDKHYPNRFEVLSTGPDDAIRNMSFKVKRSLVAEKANPLVQAELKWDKRQPDFDLTTGRVDTVFAQAQTYFQDAQDLLRILKSQGFDKPCVSLKDGIATVILFHEATEEYRRECVLKLEKAFKSWPKSEEYGKEILLMGTDAYTNMPGEILPIDYFVGRAYLKQVTYRFQLSYNDEFDGENLMDNWIFNTASDQFNAAFEKARTEVENWAKTNYKPYFFMENSEFEQVSEKPLRYQFKFAFTHKKQAEDSTEYVEADGYFVVDFDMDKNEVLKIKIELN